jgi:dephospho-CoA kinase
MLILGLTGSIGMGKSTTGKMFAEAGIPLHDSDAAVHRLYEGEAVPLIEAAFPGTTADGRVDREKLAQQVVGKPEAFRTLEGIVHPLVRAAAGRFLREAEAKGARMVVLDIPLLFETGGEGRVDAIVVVSAPSAVQHARVLGRPGMTGNGWPRSSRSRCPTRKSGDGRISWWIQAATSIPPAPRFVALSVPSQRFPDG